MTKRPSPNPADLRMILAKNLQQLCRRCASISELCREIGVNRTQFNRYLTGSAFPRPDVLFRICHHFGVDANILLHRLEDAPPAPVGPPQPAGRLVIDTQRPFDHYLLPDGLYRYWRKSFRQPGLVYLGMALIQSTDGAKRWKGYDVSDVPIRPGTKRFARSRSYEGQLIQQFDGFSLISRTPHNDQMNVTFFEYGLDALPDYYSGISFVTRRRLPEANRLSAIVMERLPNQCSIRLATARTCGTGPIDTVPSLVRAALDRVPERL